MRHLAELCVYKGHSSCAYACFAWAHRRRALSARRARRDARTRDTRAHTRTHTPTCDHRNCARRWELFGTNAVSSNQQSLDLGFGSWFGILVSWDLGLGGVIGAQRAREGVGALASIHLPSSSLISSPRPPRREAPLAHARRAGLLAGRAAHVAKLSKRREISEFSAPTSSRHDSRCDSSV